MDFKDKTLDELLSLRNEISIEIANRRTEEKITCFKVGLKGCGATYYKKFSAALSGLIEEADESTIAELNNTAYIEPVLICKSDYETRPDEWYE